MNGLNIQTVLHVSNTMNTKIECQFCSIAFYEPCVKTIILHMAHKIQVNCPRKVNYMYEFRYNPTSVGKPQIHLSTPHELRSQFNYRPLAHCKCSGSKYARATCSGLLHLKLLHLIHIYKGTRVFDGLIFIIVGKMKKPDECWFVFVNY